VAEGPGEPGATTLAWAQLVAISICEYAPCRPGLHVRCTAPQLQPPGMLETPCGGMANYGCNDSVGATAERNFIKKKCCCAWSAQFQCFIWTLDFGRLEMVSGRRNADETDQPGTIQKAPRNRPPRESAETIDAMLSVSCCRGRF